MPKVISADEAVKFINNGMTLAINAMSATGYPDALSAALYKRFEETRQPKDLSFWATTAQGMGPFDALTTRLGKCEGMFKKAVMGQWSSTPSMVKNVVEDRMAGYNFPQGVLSHLFRAAAGKKPAIITRIGLKTFVDPRFGGGKLNMLCDEDLVKVVEIEGKEYLQYETPKIDVCFIRATTADPKGNVSSEKEAVYIDAYSLALATKANNGIVIVQVERLSERMIHPQQVKIPGVSIDYIVVDPEQKQTGLEQYNPAYSGETIMPREAIEPHIKWALDKSKGFFTERKLEHYIIARRATEELKPGNVVNLGIGIPGVVASIAAEKGMENSIVMSNEAGTLGGIPAPGGSFGASLNPMAIIDMPYMFDFYDGGGIDLCCVGAAQVDAKGNVNVSKIGSVIIGLGGFANLTQSCKKVVFLTSFTDAKGFEVEYGENGLKIVSEGKVKKFVSEVEQISFSGEVAAEDGRPVLYITERCVFKLTPQGLILTEIAPGIDLQSDILDKMDFKPLIDENLKVMSKDYFKI